jgi:hypothetical protein
MHGSQCHSVLTCLVACDLFPQELPTAGTVDFIVEPAPSVNVQEDDINIVFCMDISGSMCVTKEVPGRLNLRGSHLTELARQLNTEGGVQYMPGQRRDVTYVSRLQAMQAAVDKQIQRMRFVVSHVSVIASAVAIWRSCNPAGVHGLASATRAVMSAS